MDYQVWIKEEFDERYTKVDCGDLPAARRELDKAVRAGKEPLLTVEVPYSLAIKIEDVGTEKPKRKLTPKEILKSVEEVAEHEASQGEAESDKSTGSESESEVRPGDIEPVPEQH